MEAEQRININDNYLRLLPATIITEWTFCDIRVA